MKIQLLVAGAAIVAAAILAPHEDNSPSAIVAGMNQLPGVHAYVGGK